MTMVNGTTGGDSGGGGGNGKAAAKAGPSLSREDSQGQSSKSISTDPTGPAPGILKDPMIVAPRKLNTNIPNILPYKRVFPIQIGSELFRLSGASISSNGTYFCCL
jgi:hypothetical protein